MVSVLRHARNARTPTLQLIANTTPKLIVGTVDEHMYATQTCRFLATEPCESKIYRDVPEPDAFPLLVNRPQSRDAIALIAAFLVGRRKQPG